jgi:ABC-type polysaccharide/polyol phosphate transport system ATPase subunit
VSLRPPVEVQNLNLEYRMARNQASTAKEFVVTMLKRQVTYESLHAVNDVSFAIPPGVVFGIVGANGAGKSTLLKMLAGVLPPTTGRVIVRGSVSPMIEVSGGMNAEMTGRENIILVGTLLGRPPSVMRERLPEIAVWSGLVDFMDVPVRAYSTGMKSRLGFAIATDVKPDVLLIDEVLAVGDEAFRNESLNRIKELMDGGTTVVMVSHSLPTVERLADTVMWMDHGKSRMIGDAIEVCEAYKAFAEETGADA